MARNGCNTRRRVGSGRVQLRGRRLAPLGETLRRRRRIVRAEEEAVAPGRREGVTSEKKKSILALSAVVIAARALARFAHDGNAAARSGSPAPFVRCCFRIDIDV
jgi:hypothetical protein